MMTQEAQEQLLDKYYEIFQEIANLGREIDDLKKKYDKNNAIQIGGDDVE